MYEVKALVRPHRAVAVIEALHALPDMPGITTSTNTGYGRSSASAGTSFGRVEIVKIETVVPEALVEQVIDTIRLEAATGRTGDGKIFVTRVDRAVQIRSGDSGPGVL